MMILTTRVGLVTLVTLLALLWGVALLDTSVTMRQMALFSAVLALFAVNVFLWSEHEQRLAHLLATLRLEENGEARQARLGLTHAGLAEVLVDAEVLSALLQDAERRHTATLVLPRMRPVPAQGMRVRVLAWGDLVVLNFKPAHGHGHRVMFHVEDAQRVVQALTRR